MYLVLPVWSSRDQRASLAERPLQSQGSGQGCCVGVVDSHISTVPQPLYPERAAGPYRLAQLVGVTSMAPVLSLLAP